MQRRCVGRCAVWAKVVGTNLMGAANVTWSAVRHLRERDSARIVNVSSRGAFRGEPTAPAYGASKAGLNAFGQSIAVALAPHGITVATVAPGFVETEMAQIRSPVRTWWRGAGSDATKTAAATPAATATANRPPRQPAASAVTPASNRPPIPPTVVPAT